MTLKQFRHQLNDALWRTYCATSTDMQAIDAALFAKGVKARPLDHYAIIDLPGTQSGIPHLHALFAALGYQKKGCDYLADKQNDFLWVAEENCESQLAHDALPQIVVADFRPAELPMPVRNIIEKYAAQTKQSPLTSVRDLTRKIAQGDADAASNCIKLITDYLTGRDWPLPTVNEFKTVREFNELLAWVLVYGRRPNHFTLSIHLMEHFTDLDDFNHFIENDVKLTLNQEGGKIKGGTHTGIAQASTTGIKQTVLLADGEVEIPTDFVEFVWRYPVVESLSQPPKWQDYFTGFIAQHANKVIESLWMGQNKVEA